VIVVTYNSSSTLEKCLESVPEYCEIVVVDQQSSDGSAELASKLRPDSKVLRAGANRGFGAGCNLGAANATGSVLIFLNPDASFHSFDSVQILADCAMKKNALVGPSIIGPQGSDETRARYWSTIISELGEIVLPIKLMVGNFRRDIPVSDEVYRRGGDVPYVQGCCMAISAANFWCVSGFDERLFLYREEEMISLCLKKKGVRVLLEPSALISHHGGVSTSQVRNFAARQYYRSEAIFLSEKYPPLLAFIAVSTLRIMLWIMAILSPVRSIIDWRADKNYGWYREAATGAADGWRRRMVELPSMNAPVIN